MTWTATLKNNTDYPQGITFTDTDELKSFVSSYYGGEWGDLYSESWTVDGDYPDEVFDVLEPPEADYDQLWQVKL